ncbi:hypothetical protein JO84_gp268 [Aureococcus anophagefferens virus]|uniref:Uncharacterized protein n=1 Tax=Aureococcus anophagefferens virus TaxID=1474867 RepID=A0A076FG51_9VIRU|nr:hypothetical protein JO84_gp268 [Aureococcus anophagefferens virus]AII17005.1 hypothetical protein AaV_207 [Aureococcus anophagefferens virus]UOG94121.1 hypothetical protein MKD35_80 [Aureococcus anophagefferens virus]
MIEIDKNELELLKLIFSYEFINEYEIFQFIDEEFKYVTTYKEFLENDGDFDTLIDLFKQGKLIVDIDDMQKDYDKLQEKAIITLLQSIMVDKV